MQESPNDGGCWFCETDDNKGGWAFSSEFDAYVHVQCLRTAARCPDDPEAAIMAKELGIEPEEEKNERS